MLSRRARDARTAAASEAVRAMPPRDERDLRDLANALRDLWPDAPRCPGAVRDPARARRVRASALAAASGISSQRVCILFDAHANLVAELADVARVRMTAPNQQHVRWLFVQIWNAPSPAPRHARRKFRCGGLNCTTPPTRYHPGIAVAFCAAHASLTKGTVPIADAPAHEREEPLAPHEKEKDHVQRPSRPRRAP